MAEAVSPYVAWMNTTAAQAEQAATHARYGRGRVRDRARRDSASAADRDQPCSARAVGVDERDGPKHRPDRGPGIRILAKCGPRRRSDVRLRRHSATAAEGDAVYRGTGDRQPGRLGHPGRRGHPSRRQLGRHGAVNVVHVVNGVPNTLQSLATPAASSAASSTKSSEPLSWLWSVLFGTSVSPHRLRGLDRLHLYAQSAYYTVGIPYFSIGMVTYLLQSGNIEAP